MVTPFALTAAMPVGATIIHFLAMFCQSVFRKVDLPVPAFPVRKTDLSVVLINSEASLKVSLISIVFIEQQEFFVGVAGELQI